MLRYHWAPDLTLTYLFPCILSTAKPNASTLHFVSEFLRFFEAIEHVTSKCGEAWECTGAYASAYTNAWIAATAHLQFNPRSEVESSRRSRVFFKRAIGSDTNHAHYTRRGFALDCARGFADLAI
jgi:hypothetical protein